MESVKKGITVISGILMSADFSSKGSVNTVKSACSFIRKELLLPKRKKGKKDKDSDRESSSSKDSKGGKKNKKQKKKKKEKEGDGNADRATHTKKKSDDRDRAAASTLQDPESSEPFHEQGPGHLRPDP